MRDARQKVKLSPEQSNYARGVREGIADLPGLLAKHQAEINQAKMLVRQKVMEIQAKYPDMPRLKIPSINFDPKLETRVNKNGEASLAQVAGWVFADDPKKIFINPAYLETGHKDQVLTKTVVHELAHSIEGQWRQTTNHEHHSDMWKALMRQMGYSDDPHHDYTL